MNLTKKATTAPLATPDIFRLFREMAQADPFLQPWPAGFARGELPTFAPSFELKETEEGYTVHADLPGVKEKDLEVSIQGNRVTMSGKRESEKSNEKDKYYVYEREFGAFTRTFMLPADVDATKAMAELKDGVLTFFVPKKASAQSTKVNVKT